MLIACGKKKWYKFGEQLFKVLLLSFALLLVIDLSPFPMLSDPREDLLQIRAVLVQPALRMPFPQRTLVYLCLKLIVCTEPIHHSRIKDQ